MAVLQSKQEEIRYIKRENLDEEARIYQNYFRDLIHSYGVDCNYYKISVPYPEKFRRTIDNNNILMHAYGYDSNPDYEISAKLITFMEVEQDAFNLNKTGHFVNSDVTFAFDRNEFAAKFASKLGKLIEYKIHEHDIDLEIPKQIDEFITYKNQYGESERYYLGEDISRYAEQCGFPMTFDSDILSGTAGFVISSYVVGKEYDIPAVKYQHSDGGYMIPVNKDIYRSFNYKVDITEYLDILPMLRFKVDDIVVGKDEFGNEISKRILHGTIHGGILFHDINEIGKYMDIIQPNEGDIVTIDFPNEKSRESYEITESIDKNLGQDGLNPLMHKYIWKCKARRYVNGGENKPENSEADDRVQEALDNILQSEEDIDKNISRYDETNNDAVYGGYELDKRESDKNIIRNDNPDIRTHEIDGNLANYEQFVDDGSYDSIHVFSDGSRIVTDGYAMYYVSSDNVKKPINCTEMNEGVKDLPNIHWTIDGIKYLAATDEELWFRNFDNKTFKLAESRPITNQEREICYNSLIEATYDTDKVNDDGDMFFKFANTKTILMSLGGDLFCRFCGKGKKMIRLT